MLLLAIAIDNGDSLLLFALLISAPISINILTIWMLLFETAIDNADSPLRLILLILKLLMINYFFVI